MCFFDHSFAHIFFVFHFVAKPMLEFRENMMFVRTVLKSGNYNYLSRRKVLFSQYNFASLRIVEGSAGLVVAGVREKPSNWIFSPRRTASVLAFCTLQSAILYTNGTIHSAIWIH